MKSVERADVERLRVQLAARLGFQFPDDKLDVLAEVAEQRMAVTSAGSMALYLQRLASPEARDEELAALAQALTVTETFFFRNVEQFRAFADVVVGPVRARGRRTLRVLSAGCASGEEPYSLAIALREALPDFENWDLRVLAIDVNRAMLEKAKKAVYSEWSLRATPEAIRRRYFNASGREIALCQSIRDMVSFQERNLVDDAPAYWSALACDAVFCRNVLMYFTSDTMQRVVERLALALLPGGFLFLGHADSLRGTRQNLRLCHTHETFYYQRYLEGDVAPTASLTPIQSIADVPMTPELTPRSDTWFEAIHQASERVVALTSGREPPEPAASTATTVTNDNPARRNEGSSLEAIIALVERERFAEALASLQALPASSSQRPEALLLGCVILTNTGKHTEAETACKRLLALDGQHAGAHYLMALCREHARDLGDAILHDQAAVYRDPSFAMPHLHLGLMAKRRGERALARRELSQALVLLEREDSARLRLFGGGFSRDGLTRLCSAELSDIGADT
jgi:chemotaxis protein methyltransferase CheR